MRACRRAKRVVHRSLNSFSPGESYAACLAARRGLTPTAGSRFDATGRRRCPGFLQAATFAGRGPRGKRCACGQLQCIVGLREARRRATRNARRAPYAVAEASAMSLSERSQNASFFGIRPPRRAVHTMRKGHRNVELRACRRAKRVMHCSQNRLYCPPPPR
ncbi:hypothetical protein DENSPDRAFT_83552 [Dentipellis sp. KUC8613]|nr:hypothetical protein DENSPDRAFT_83552 [Dentipellis sp. KUC8613]